MPAIATQFPRRSLLFMPGDALRKIEKAASWEVDTLIMDMEDGVAQNRKAEACATIAQALATLDFGRRERLVRANHVSTGRLATEIAATVGGRPDGYVLPKAEDPAELQAADRLIAASIVRLSPRLRRVAEHVRDFGPDYNASEAPHDLGMKPATYRGAKKRAFEKLKWLIPTVMVELGIVPQRAVTEDVLRARVEFPSDSDAGGDETPQGLE